MYRRTKDINIILYLDDLLFLITGCEACRRLARIVEEDMHRAGLTINWEKSDGNLWQERLHLGFVVSEGFFKVPFHRWEALRTSDEKIISAKDVRVQSWKLASLFGLVISMKLAWGPIIQLYTRNLFRILNKELSLKCWITLCDEALNELHFWNDLPGLRFE